MRQIFTGGRGILAISAATLGTGCMTLPAVYGESWSDPVQLEANACPDIDGEYHNAGEQFRSGSYQRQLISLVYLLGSHAELRNDVSLDYTFEDAGADAYQTVRLQLAGKMLQVVATRADGSRRTFELPTSEECRDSMLVLGPAWGSDSMLVVSMVGRNTLALGRAEDGSLLVRDSDSGVATILWIPLMAGSEATWTLFPPATAPALEPVPVPEIMSSVARKHVAGPTCGH